MTYGTASTASTVARSQWRFVRQWLDDYLGLAGLTAIGFFLVTTLISLGVNRWDELTSSVWLQATNQVARWFVLFIGVHLTSSVVVLHIAHGRSRRDFSRDFVVFCVGFAVGVAVLTLIGLGLEALLYRLLDAPQAVETTHLYTSAGQLHLIFAEFFLLYLVWTLGGGLLGIAFYRSSSLGMLAIPLAMVGAVILDYSLGIEDGVIGAPMRQLLDIGAPPLIIALVLGLTAAALMAAGTWHWLRDVPLRSKEA